MIDVQFPDMWLLTIEELQTYLKRDAEDLETTRPNLVQAIRQASADIITFLRRVPLPHVRAWEYDAPRTRFLSAADLLEVIELLNPKVQALESADYRLRPLNSFPKTLIEMKKNDCDGWQSWCGSQWNTVQLTGRFGYVPHWQYAWERIGTAELAVDALTLDVAAVASFGTGDTLRMGDEYLFVREVTPGDAAPAGTLSLRRGALGTTAAAHESGTAIERFLLLDVIHSNAIEWAAYLEKSRGQVGKRVQVSEQGLLVVNELSPLVKEALLPHQYNPVVQLL